MQSLATEIDAQTSQERMAKAILRLEASINKLRARDEVRKQVATDLDNCIASIEEILNNSKEK